MMVTKTTFHLPLGIPLDGISRDVVCCTFSIDQHFGEFANFGRLL